MNEKIERPKKRRHIAMQIQRDVALAQLEALMRKVGLIADDAEISWALDHDPALELRAFNPVTGETLPAHDDPRALVWRTTVDHAVKTTGRRGESRLSKRGGDISEIAKLRRLEAHHEDFRRRMLAKDEPDLCDEVGEGVVARPGQKFKRKWASRPFPKREKPERVDRRRHALD